MIEVEVRSRLAGALGQLRLWNRFGVHAIAVDRAGKVDINPSASYELKPGDEVVLIGSNQAVETIRAYLTE